MGWEFEGSQLTVGVASGRRALPQHVPVEPAAVAGALAAAHTVYAEGPEVEHGLRAELHVSVALIGGRTDLGAIDLDEADVHLGLPERVEGRRKPERVQVDGSEAHALDDPQT